MRLPNMKYTENRQQKTVVQFLGVNYGENTADGQFAETENLSARMFPCLSQRQGRAAVNTYQNPTAVWYKNGLIVVDGTDLKHNGVVVGTVSPGKKQFANVNTKVVIFPDKVMYDTKSDTESDTESKKFRSLEAEFVSEAGAVEFTGSNALKVHLGNYQGVIASFGTVGGGSKAEILYRYNGRDSDETESRFAKLFEYKVSSVTVNAETGAVTVQGKTADVVVEDWNEGDLFIDSSLGMDGVTSWGKIIKKYKRHEMWDFNDPITGQVIGRESKDYAGFDYNRYEVRGKSYEALDGGWEGMNFRKGDTVEISGCTTYEANNKTATIREITEEESDAGTLYSLVFDKEMFANGKEAGAVTVKRSVPDLTVICEQDNRLYGAAGNTIYVSALGDPTNFNTYDGVDTDSYSVAVATEGDFTGCIGYGNGVLFFKEDCLHKLLGRYPSEYALYDYTVPGVAKGSEGSIVNINEVVYYHGREGVYRYSGSAPERITADFGLRRFDSASAGAQGNLYYISMRDKAEDKYSVWVYDTGRGIWLREDGTKAVGFARDGGKLYFIDGDANTLVLANPEESDEAISWSATFCTMTEIYLNRKIYSKLLLRLEQEDGAEVKIEVRCDGGEWKTHKQFKRGPHKTVLVPIVPNRCDSFQIRISGTGRTVIRTMVREFEFGGDY